MLQVEGDDNGDSDDCKIGRQSQPREESSLIRAVITTVGRGVHEEDWREERSL